MFVTVLLVAGSIALEREENAYARITRGLVGPGALLAEKVLLGVVASLVVTLLMLAGLSIFVEVDWGRILLIASRDRRRRRSIRGVRRGDRLGRARGPGVVAARVHGLAADRVPVAGSLGNRRRRHLPRDRGRPRAVPVRPGARRDGGRRSTRPAPGSACRSCTWRRSRRLTGCLPGWPCAALPSYSSESDSSSSASRPRHGVRRHRRAALRAGVVLLVGVSPRARRRSGSSRAPESAAEPPSSPSSDDAVVVGRLLGCLVLFFHASPLVGLVPGRERCSRWRCRLSGG